ncbi:MAG: glycosyltransferase family 39 protein [Actinobacteria bacterium]|nr:MAG: glycosyltransferase family 39 protein [Actinomycetota bacterium]
MPGEPSAYTQPLYGFFLVPIYWIFGRTWWAAGGAQIVVATATAVLVYAIGARVLSRRAGFFAAVIATLNPYLVWHDVHLNREVLDQLLAAALVLCTLIASERRSVKWATAAGICGGLAVLGNVRLAFLPIAVGAYLVFRNGWSWAPLAVLAAAAARSAASPSPPTHELSGRRTTRRPTTCSPPESGSTTSRILPVTRIRTRRRRVTSTGRAARRSTWTSARTRATTSTRPGCSCVNTLVRRRSSRARRSEWSGIPARPRRRRTPVEVSSAAGHNRCTCRSSMRSACSAWRSCRGASPHSRSRFSGTRRLPRSCSSGRRAIASRPTS